MLNAHIIFSINNGGIARHVSTVIHKLLEMANHGEFSCCFHQKNSENFSDAEMLEMFHQNSHNYLI